MISTFINMAVLFNGGDTDQILYARKVNSLDLPHIQYIDYNDESEFCQYLMKNLDITQLPTTIVYEIVDTEDDMHDAGQIINGGEVPFESIVEYYHKNPIDKRIIYSDLKDSEETGEYHYVEDCNEYNNLITKYFTYE